MNHISLFSGIGGDTLAAEWAGFETVLFVEIDKFCQKVLKKHWPDVPIIGDIHNVTKEKVMAYTNKQGLERGIRDNGEFTQQGKETSTYTNGPRGSWEITSQVDRCGGDGSRETTQILQAQGTETIPQSPITLITGGFPCQPVSVAGKQRGKEDDRWLWPEMLRVIKEVRPKWVVAENVAGLIRMGIDDCISDLENIGYTTESYLIPACAVNAPHRRDRVFIVAHSKQQGLEGYSEQQAKPTDAPNRCYQGQDVADTINTGNRTSGNGDNRDREKVNQEWQGQSQPGIDRQSWWAVEPDVGRVAYGIPSRVDRLKALGNAIVPQQIYPILKAIAELELKV